MRIEFDRCEACYRILHYSVCTECDGNVFDFEARGLQLEKERLALLIISALEERVPFNLLLTRAIY